ncbi:MAG: hypothetical protein IT260_21990 [Saprospiraceae bacterium]|nr:hypothetical protein [Saprospiraceae bacterium]
MLTFNAKGFLVPDRVISSSLEELKSVFVHVQPEQELRSQLWDNFVLFFRKLLADLGLPEIMAWINGSYTTRKRNPNDMDIVIFLPFDVLIRHETQLRSVYDHQTLLATLHLDVYFVALFPNEHPNSFLTIADRAYWIEKFTRTRPDHRGLVHKKGVLELNINANEIC